MGGGLYQPPPAVMHLVFLGRDQHFEPRFHPRLHLFRVLDLLTQKGLRGAFQNLGVLLALGAQQFQYLRLCARRLHFCLQLAPQPEEIEANQRAAVLHRMDLLLHARHHRNVHQRLRYRAASLRRTKTVLLFRDLLGNFDRIIADRAERSRELFCSVISQ